MEDMREMLVRMEERQIAQGKQIDNLEEKLFGNGQPGILERLHKRILALEIKFWATFGGGVTVVTLVGWYLIARYGSSK